MLEGSYGPAGSLKVGRKGVGRYVIRAFGTAAHAGLEPGEGASAVLEISHQIQRLFDLNDVERGVTVNVGTVDGGMRPNVVAPEASAHIDVRVFTAEDGDQVDAAIRALEPVDDGVRLEVEGGFDRPPMERNPANEDLWRQASAIGEELGLDLDAAVVGGASDGNLTSQFVPTLDGLGAVGGGAHRVDEHVAHRVHARAGRPRRPPPDGAAPREGRRWPRPNDRSGTCCRASPGSPISTGCRSTWRPSTGPPGAPVSTSPP